MTAVAEPRTRDAARAALGRATEHLLSLQHPDGWWKGELETNVTIDAEDVFLRHYLRLPDVAETTHRSAGWIRAHQRPDGSWATFFGGPADLSTTVEAYVALRIAGDPPEAAHMRRAAAFVRDAGGAESSRVFTRMWLSLLSLWSWHDVPVLPPEQILLPPRAPLSIYSFGCWARQTVVALQVVTTLRPTTTVEFEIPELRTRGDAPQHWLDRGLHLYDRRPVPWLRRRALDTAERWIVERQEADGSWGGIQPPWVWSMIALHARGYSLDHPVMKLGLAGLDSFTIDDEDGRRLEACQSPVWDTALALIALLDAGVPPGHPALARGAGWLAGREVRIRGDWAVRKPKLATGGFPFEFANENYPDVDDTAVVVLALRRLGAGGAECARGIDWMLGMQSSDGGWGAFDVDNTSNFVAKLPFCDFGAVTDPPSADVTAHVLETMSTSSSPSEAETEARRAGLEWLLREQERDGSWFGRWGANHVYGTGAVLPALAACGLHDHPSVAHAVDWLARVQNPSGGFGEDLRSYRDASWRGRGAPTASQTAWALIGLHAADPGGHSPVSDRAIRYLVETQLPDGGWDEPYYTGTGFPGDFYLNYHLYRDVFPVMALGRVLA
jgi:squalene-hopene/tetraprenyl-beta-curcumene cyclase